MDHVTNRSLYSDFQRRLLDAHDEKRVITREAFESSLAMLSDEELYHDALAAFLYCHNMRLLFEYYVAYAKRASWIDQFYTVTHVIADGYFIDKTCLAWFIVGTQARPELRDEIQRRIQAMQSLAAASEKIMAIDRTNCA